MGTEKELREAFHDADTAKVAMLEANLQGKMFCCSIGLNDLVAMPPGYMLAERTLTSSAYGMKRNIFYKATSLEEITCLRGPSARTELIAKALEKLS